MVTKFLLFARGFTSILEQSYRGDIEEIMVTKKCWFAYELVERILGPIQSLLRQGSDQLRTENNDEESDDEERLKT
ncbi:21709_t:CDS:2, partial [Gigaspora rosea]